MNPRSLPTATRYHITSHVQAFAEIHLKTGPFHLLSVERIERFRLSDGEHVAPSARPSLSQVLQVFLGVGLGVALHRGDR